jgi:glucokinase
MKLGRFTGQGACLAERTWPTPQPSTPQRVCSALVEAIAEIDPHGEATAIGIGTPGPADAAGRIARIAINLEDWREVPLADWLEAQCHRRVVLDNDANCAGQGEAWLGAGQTFQDFILLTLGTGVGGAIFFNGQLFKGLGGAAGELGLITLRPEGPPCNSGNRGSLEQYTSIRAIRRITGFEPDQLGQLAQAGNPDALEFWHSYGRDLGAGLASLLYVLTPQAVLLGGGVAASAEFFLPALKAELEQRVMPTSRTGLKILPAQLGNRAGMLGAARLALQTFQLS